MAEEAVRTDGFAAVDSSGRADAMIASMDATAAWPATVALRAWSSPWLDAPNGGTVLDVGCGTAAALRTIALVRPDLHCIGIDASEAMLAEGLRRADAAGADLDLRLGDAAALSLDDESVDAARAERTLQWLTDPVAGVRELIRVCRPGAGIVLIDSDFASLVSEHPEPDLFGRVVDGMIAARPASTVGRSLLTIARDNGLERPEVQAATHVWTEWDAEVDPSPSGFIPLVLLAEAVVARAVLTTDEADRLVRGYVETARAGRFFLSLTMYAVAARAPTIRG